MDKGELLVALFGAGGVGLILRSLTDGAMKHFTGSAGREKSRNNDLKSQRDGAMARADRLQEAADFEARRRRIAQEHAGQLRHMLLERGVPPDELPPWPTEHPSQIPKP